MRFSIVSKASGLPLGEYDEASPAVRLTEGAPAAGAKRPLDLAPGEETLVAYPLDRTKGEATRQIVCRVTRLDGVPTEPSPDRKIEDPLAWHREASIVELAPAVRRRRVARAS